MHRHNVRTAQDALYYLTECTLATVSNLAEKKTPPKAELSRQIEMAQLGVNWIREFGISICGCRVQEVMECGGSVQAWTEQFRAK